MHSKDISPGTLTIGSGPEVAAVDPEQAARDAATFREVLYFAVSIPLVIPAIRRRRRDPAVLGPPLRG